MSTEIKDRIDSIRRKFNSLFLDESTGSFSYILNAIEKLDDPLEKEKILMLIEKDVREAIYGIQNKNI